jgi:hypothetical protein
MKLLAIPTLVMTPVLLSSFGLRAVIATLAFFVVCLPSCVNAEPIGDDHLFILSGQSNMAHLDHRKTFVPVVTEAFGADHVVVVKSAFNGQPIRRWDKSWELLEAEKHRELQHDLGREERLLRNPSLSFAKACQNQRNPDSAIGRAAQTLTRVQEVF